MLLNEGKGMHQGGLFLCGAKRFLVWALIGTGLLLGSSRAWGRMTIIPRVDLQEEYNDNLFLTNGNKLSDYITTAVPGVNLFLPARYFQLSLDYALQYRFYADHASLNETALSDVQRINFHGDLFPGNDFTVNVIDEMGKVVVSQRGPTVAQNAFLNKVNQNRFYVYPHYRYRLTPTFDALLGYQFEMYTYSSQAGQASRSHTGRFELTKNFSPRLRMNLGAIKRYYKIQVSSDYQRQDVFLSGSYKLGPRTTLDAGLTNSRINFKQGSNKQGLLWNAKATYSPSDRLGFDLGYSVDYLVSVDQGVYKRQGASLGINFKKLLAYQLNIYAEKSEFFETTPQKVDKSLGADLTAAIPLTPKLALNVNGNGSILRFQPDGTDVVRYGAGFDLGYQLRLFRVSLGYAYYRNNSDNPSVAESYINNVVIARFQASLPGQKGPQPAAARFIPLGSREAVPSVSP